MEEKFDNSLVKKKKGGDLIAFRAQDFIFAKYSLSAFQQDILDFLFSIVACEGDDDDNLTYQINVAQMIKSYNSVKDTSKRYTQLKNAVKEFKNKGFELVDKNTGDNIYYSWFTKIKYNNAKLNSGENSIIEVDIHPDVKRLILGAGQGAFYRKDHSMNIRSDYARKLYYICVSRLELNGGEFTISVEELISKLSIPADSYTVSKIKVRILDKAKEEFIENTDIEMTYEDVKSSESKRGRAGIEAFHFKVKKVKKNNTIIDIDCYNIEGKEHIASYLEETLKCSAKEANQIVAHACDRGYIVNDNYDKLKELVEYAIEKNPDSICAYIHGIMLKGFQKTNKKEESAYKDMNFEEFEQLILAN